MQLSRTNDDRGMLERDLEHLVGQLSTQEVKDFVALLRRVIHSRDTAKKNERERKERQNTGG